MRRARSSFRMAPRPRRNRISSCRRRAGSRARSTKRQWTQRPASSAACSCCAVATITCAQPSNGWRRR